MCGIAGYIGGGNAPKILFDMLKRLEYRGYDSAGIAYISGGRLNIPKDRGKVDDVRRKINPEKLSSNIGVAHTRWATHGQPSQINSHPHADCSGRFAIAHNGIIENYLELKHELQSNGHKFKSETDTEVISHLIEEYYECTSDFTEAFAKTLGRLKGSFALTAISSLEQDKILVARKESPLLIGLGSGGNYIASDTPAILPYTQKVIILDDMEYGTVTKDKVEIRNIKTNKKTVKKTQTISWTLDEAEKSGYHHFMLKEINEEPEAAKNALKEEAKIRGIARKISRKKRVYFVACGTAYHAGLTGRYILEHYGIQAEAVVASEFRYSTVETLDRECAVIAVSQSGETADTIAAVKESRRRGAYVASIVNVVGSTLTRISDDTAYIYSGPEIAVASTKAYIGQLVSITLLGLYLAKERRKIRGVEFERRVEELKNIPGKISRILERSRVKHSAEKYANTKTFFYIGRNINYPTALEGALKLKEISYVHAEGYPAGELKHGPLALLDRNTVVLAITQEDSLKEKMASNIQEAKARGADILVVSSENSVFKVPKVSFVLSPIVSIVPLHLFAYYISVLKGIDPDKPRNLAKSVTVE